MVSPPASSPRASPRRFPLSRARRAAGRAKEQVERMFITQPRMPVLLMVTISSSDTITETQRAAAGPHRMPPRAMMISFGSYFKNNTTGTRPRQTAA